MINDMKSELFISVPASTDYWVPPKSKEEYLTELEVAVDKDEKAKALIALIEISRCQRNLDQVYNETLSNELIGLLQRHGQNPELTERVAGLLIREGGRCEALGDYSIAIKFYESSLQFEIEGEECRYYRLNNLAFCLNYMKRFQESENFLRLAIEICPERYNAWKNLGVSLEHQGQFEESAECYLRAITLSKGERRSIMHLQRLVDRYPALKKVSVIAEFYAEPESGSQ